MKAFQILVHCESFSSLLKNSFSLSSDQINNAWQNKAKNIFAGVWFNPETDCKAVRSQRSQLWTAKHILLELEK